MSKNVPSMQALQAASHCPGAFRFVGLDFGRIKSPIRYEFTSRNGWRWGAYDNDSTTPYLHDRDVDGKQEV